MDKDSGQKEQRQGLGLVLKAGWEGGIENKDRLY